MVIKPGDKIPVDGEVTEGSSQVDESMLTGESMPVKKVVDKPVIGATINKSGSFHYKATKVGADTALAQIVKLVQEAQNSKAPGQLLADQASQWLVLAAIAAGVEKFSEHPLAQAVLKRAGTAPVEVATGFANIDGQGARATIGTEAVLLGNRKLMQAEYVSPASMTALVAEATRLEGGGRTVVFVARAGQLIGLIAIADAVRPTSQAMIAKLQERGVKVAMMTGDKQATAERIGKALGIDIVLAEVLPGQKAAKIKELQDQGNKVGMVGDGINDAPALTQADVGFAIGAGTDVAMESAQVVLMKSDPYDVVGAIELSRATLRKMQQNLWWAAGYNVIALPLAAGVFYPFTLSPEIAALSMSGSSAVVAINALMLKRTKLAGIKRAGSPGVQSTAAKLAAGASA